MRLPLEWLHEHCAPDMPADALAERLAMTGTEVERVTRHGVGGVEHFVVGKVLAADPHPDADRLRVCQVDVGDGGEARQIVCGAPNVAAGQTVAVAHPGAVMPDGTRLKAAKLRGVVSDGMILAEDELGIGTDHAGIMVLDGALAAGTALAQVLPLATEVLELEITPNRPDCLAVYGVAREVHAATGAPLGPPPWAEDAGSPGPVAGFAVEVEDAELCPRFTARLFEDVRLGPSPPWLKARLMAAGQRPINNVVDITNYVMLLTGQPLHAFDADLVAGGRLRVRRGRDGETLTTLDDVERRLDSEMVVIEDAEGVTSLAGIMGGERSEVRETTARVLMEAASWNGPNLQRTSTRLSLRTEASGRFEKQLQPEQASQGLAVATRLMIELAGARLAPGTIDVGAPPAEIGPIRLRRALQPVLGVGVEPAEVQRLLEALGFGLVSVPEADAQTWDWRPPPWRRGDVTREIDVIEEIARLVALERLPSTLPSRRGATGRLTFEQRARRRAEDALLGCGISEAVGWSFESRDVVRRLRLAADDPRGVPVALANPMSEEQAVMRTTLLASLLDSLRRNRARGAEDVRLFESGHVYLGGPPTQPAADIYPFRASPPGGAWAGRVRDGDLPRQPRHLAVGLCGTARRATWREPRPPRADLFAAKGVLEALARALRVELAVEAASEPFLHPGRAARVLAAGAEIGWLGELHPRVAADWDLDAVAGFEIDLDALVAAAPRELPYRDLISFPALRQDLAIVVGQDASAARVVSVIREAGGALLRSAEVFDAYQGEQVGEGRTSLAVRLEFRADDRTLTDTDVSEPRELIVAALRAQLGAELRG